MFDFICGFCTFKKKFNGFLQMESNNLQEQLQKLSMIFHFQNFSVNHLAHMVGMQDYNTSRNGAILEATLKKVREEMDTSAK